MRSKLVEEILTLESLNLPIRSNISIKIQEPIGAHYALKQRRIDIFPNLVLNDFLKIPNLSIIFRFLPYLNSESHFWHSLFRQIPQRRIFSCADIEFS